MDKNLETSGEYDRDEDREKRPFGPENNDFDDDEDISESSELKKMNGNSNNGANVAKEISAPYDMPHYPIEVEEQRKIVMPQLEQFAHKEFEERTKALPHVSSKDHLFLMEQMFHGIQESGGDVSAPNSGITSHQLDTGSAGLTTPVTGVCKDSSLVNGGFDSELRSPEVETDFDYVPHFQRVYISGMDSPSSGVSSAHCSLLCLISCFRLIPGDKCVTQKPLLSFC